MTALYELTEQYRLLTDLAFDEADEDGSIGETFVGVLSTLTDDIDAKLSALCRVVRELQQVEASAKNEAAFLTNKARRAEHAAELLKNYMHENLESLGETKRKVDDIFTVSIQASPPRLEVLDMAKVPAAFDVPQERKIDASKIKELLKKGAFVPGCQLIRGTHLRIR